MLGFNIGTNPARSPVTNREGTAQMDQPFWGILTKFMGSIIGDMLQAQHIQNQTTAAPIAHVGHRKFYIDWALTALMEYAQVYTDSGIPIICGKFQMFK